MADVLDNALSWLETQRTRHRTRLVTYTRGEASAEVAATIGKTVFRIDDQYGASIRSESRDYLILAAHLVLDGQVILPQRGDQIRESAGDQVWVYEVLGPGDEPCFRYSDPGRLTLRIHTQQIEQEAV